MIIEDFLRTGKLGQFGCRTPRQEVLAFIGAGYKTATYADEEIVHFHAFKVWLGRALGEILERGLVSGFGFYFAHGDIMPPHLRFQDFALDSSTETAALIGFMTDKKIQFEGESNFTVTAGGVVLSHHTSRLTSLVVPCRASRFWSTFLEGEPRIERMLEHRHSVRDIDQRSAS